MTYWVLVWVVTATQYCNPYREYDKENYEIFRSTDALYQKWYGLDVESRKNSRIFSGIEYEIKPMYDIKVIQKQEVSK